MKNATNTAQIVIRSKIADAGIAIERGDLRYAVDMLQRVTVDEMAAASSNNADAMMDAAAWQLYAATWRDPHNADAGYVVA